MNDENGLKILKVRVEEYVNQPYPTLNIGVHHFVLFMMNMGLWWVLLPTPHY